MSICIEGFDDLNVSPSLFYKWSENGESTRKLNHLFSNIIDYS